MRIDHNCSSVVTSKVVYDAAFVERRHLAQMGRIDRKVVLAAAGLVKPNAKQEARFGNLKSSIHDTAAFGVA